jgi:acetylornithine deacetylase/succinyl-diaminopimelate desuccinylase-like protein
MTDVPEDGLVDLLAEIIARETVNPPGNESALANYFVERFEASSVEFDIELQEVQPGRPNVIARVLPTTS